MTATSTPPPFKVGDLVDVVDATERVGLYGQYVGRTGRVVRLHLGGSEPLFDVEVPPLVPLPFTADELRPAAAAPVGPVPRLIDCEICTRGVMVARPVTDLSGPGVVVLCPRCEGRGAFLELVEDVLPDLAAWSGS